MTNETRLKTLKHITWNLCIPDCHCSTVSSENFQLQDCRCHLRIHLGSNCISEKTHICIYFESDRELQRPITTTVRASSAFSNSYSNVETTNNVKGHRETIWTYRKFVESGQLWTFEVDLIIDDALVKKDDKIVQTGSYLNGSASQESLQNDFSKLLENGLNHDIEIKCGKLSLKAHKAVLCARSEVFNAMLQSDMLEGKTGVVHIQDMDECLFRNFVQYLYTGSLPELTFDKAKALYEMGDKYDVRSLMLRCSEYLQDILSEENIIECFSLGDAHSDQKLKDEVITYILDKKLYLVNECWLPFSVSFPKVAVEVYRQSSKKRKIDDGFISLFGKSTL